MNSQQPKLFLWSLLLPVLWLTVGATFSYLFPEKRLGIWGIVLIIYFTLVPFCWYLAKRCGRYLRGVEVWKMIGYLTFWALICESLAIWYLVTLEPNMNLAGDVLLFTIGFTAAMDFLFMFLGVKFAGKKIFNFFLGVPQEAQA